MTTSKPEGGPPADTCVLDVTVARAGPTCVRQLADWRADVIRIDPAGDVGTSLLDWSSSDFRNMHRNKRSFALDLRTGEGKEVFDELVKTADIVSETSTPPVSPTCARAGSLTVTETHFGELEQIRR